MKIPEISFHKSLQSENDKVFSILIPSWNNLSFLKVCVESIQKNSRFRHQIIIHINQGSDGTLEWVRETGFTYSYSAENAGVCYAFNAASTLADADYLCLIDDDKYLCPDWDLHLYNEIRGLGHDYFSVSGTMIEPIISLNPCCIAPADFGRDPQVFMKNEIEFLAKFRHLPFHDWNGSSWYPLVVSKNMFRLVGGLSVEYSPGMYSDPDFMMKLWQAGVRYFKGVDASRCYHFVSRSVSRVKKNDGRKQFLKKWGMSSSTFKKLYLREGEVFNGELIDPANNFPMKKHKVKDQVKLLFVR